MTATPSARGIADKGEVQIKAGSVLLAVELSVPENATGVVLFATEVAAVDIAGVTNMWRV